MGSLIALVAPDTSSAEKAHGLGLFKRGCVTALTRTGAVICASVQDGYRRFVEVDTSPDANDDEFFYCSCESHGRNLNPCAHVYAALVAAETRYPDLAARASGSQPPSWKLQLEQVRRSASQISRSDENPPASDTRGELLYVIDLEQSQIAHLPTLMLATRHRLASGNWSKPRYPRESITAATLADPRDRLLVALLQGGARAGYGYYGYYSQGMALPSGMWDLAFPEMSATQRLVTRRNNADTNLQPLAWDDAGTWEFVLQASLDAGQREYVLTGEFRRGDQRMPLDAAACVLPQGLVFTPSQGSQPGKVARLKHHNCFGWIASLRKLNAIRVPKRERAELLKELFTSTAIPSLDFPPELNVQEVRPVPVPTLKVRASKFTEPYRDQLRAEIRFDYDGMAASYGDQSASVLYDSKARRLIRRDKAAEEAFAQALRDLDLRQDNRYGQATLFLIKPRRFPQLVPTLIPQGWRVEAEGKLYRQAGQIDIQVSSGIDWFDLQGKVDFDGQSVALPRLLEALRKGDNTVVLDDGTLGMLPEEWLKKYAPIASVGKTQGDQIRFTRSQAGFLDALLASQPHATWDEGFERTRQAIRGFEGVNPAPAPGSFQGELRPYQLDGLGWFDFLRTFGFGGCLADDMGLGKTVQVLALLESRRLLHNGTPRPSLVVVPRSLIFNWKQEALRFAPNLKVLDNTGTQRLRDADAIARHHLVLTTYGTLRNDISLLKDLDFDYVVLDEAQAIKNGSSESAKATRLLQGSHRLALSGTPVQNHLGDLWSLFDFLNPGLLGTASVFTGSALRNPEEETRQLLSRALRPFILRRTKEQVASDLPAKMEQTLFCELEPQQRKLYDELKDHYRQSLLKTVADQGINKSKIMILEALLRLRQAALHPGLIDRKRTADPSAKLDMLIPRLQEVIAEGHKALVFSQFTGMLSILKKQLSALKLRYEYLDGQTADRQARVDHFQTDPQCRLFLISLKAGGLGLNLTAADYVFLLDPWWNPAVEAQAIDRAHRIGQTRQVFACRLIAKDTVEEKVLALQNTKRALADAIITADNSLIRTLGKEDLELLLS